MQQLWRNVLLYVLLHMCIRQVDSDVNDINSLARHLMKRYSKNTLPTIPKNKPLKIDVQVYLLALGGVKDLEGTMASVLGLVMKWTDESITWEPTSHNYITNITMAAEDMWLPLLTAENEHFSGEETLVDKEAQKITYFNNGTAAWFQMKTLDTSCNIDATYFPFDVQSCDIELKIEGYGDDSIMFSATFQKGSIYKANGAWRITRSTVSSSMSSLKVTFDLERKPAFALVNVILPVVALALLTPLVFLLPSGTVERAGFSMATMLAISIYMKIIATNLPNNSHPLPYVSLLLFAWYTKNASIVLIIVIYTIFYRFSNQKPVPCLFRLFVVLVNCCCCKWKKCTAKQSNSKKVNAESVSQKPSAYSTQNEHDVDEDREPHGDIVPEEHPDTETPSHGQDITWKEVCAAMDVAFLFSIYVFTSIAVIAFFFILKYKLL